MYTVRTQDGLTQQIASLSELANLVPLDEHEIEWALDEFGRCETDLHTVTMSDN